MTPAGNSVGLLSAQNASLEIRFGSNLREKLKPARKKRLMQTRKMSDLEVRTFLRRFERFTPKQLKTIAILANSILAERGSR